MPSIETPHAGTEVVAVVFDMTSDGGNKEVKFMFFKNMDSVFTGVELYNWKRIRTRNSVVWRSEISAGLRPSIASPQAETEDRLQDSGRGLYGSLAETTPETLRKQRLQASTLKQLLTCGRTASKASAKACKQNIQLCD